MKFSTVTFQVLSSWILHQAKLTKKWKIGLFFEFLTLIVERDFTDFLATLTFTKKLRFNVHFRKLSYVPQCVSNVSMIDYIFCLIKSASSFLDYFEKRWLFIMPYQSYLKSSNSVPSLKIKRNVLVIFCQLSI